DREPPPVASLQPLTPPSLERVIKICLAKDPDERWQNAYDLKRELEWIADPAASVASPATRNPRREWMFGGLAAAGVLAALTLAWLHFGRPSPPAERITSSLVLPDGLALSTVAGPMVFSPEGSRLAFVARDTTGDAAGRITSVPRIWVRQMATGAVTPINGSEQASSLFWSPDGRSLGFYADGKLKRIDATGGTAEAMTDASSPAGATWLDDGSIVASVGPRQPMLRIRPQERRAELAIVHGSQSHGWPKPLPGGKAILYLDDGGGDESMLGLYSATLGSKEPGRLLLRGATNANLVDGGYLLYVLGGDIRAVRFDPAELKMTGEPIRIAQGVLFDGHLGNALFSASRQGTIAFQPGASANVSQLSVVDRTGKVLKTLGKPAANYAPRISHDGKRVAVDQSDPVTDNGDIWIGDLLRGVWSRLTYTSINESGPVWTPDDRTVYFFRNRPDKATVWYRAAGGTGAETEILQDLRSTRTLEWSRDGRYLALEVQEPDKRDSRDIWIFDKTTAKVNPWIFSPFDETAASFSPDGRWIVYASTESGKNEVYIQSYPDGQERRLISSSGGSTPAWSADGREVFYVTPERVMTAVPFRTTPSIEIGEPQALFSTRLRVATTMRQYDVMPDGTFLLNEMTGEETTRPMTLIQNWMPAER
ncbi:MAG TPA: hypothetical protein VFL80_02395, partial [Thermoanaerobaculia bacterium]|nr:hypothetical protein [Thermoanaerobaculia bacterium]